MGQEGIVVGGQHLGSTAWKEVVSCSVFKATAGVGRLALVDSKGGWRALGLAAVFVTLG